MSDDTLQAEIARLHVLLALAGAPLYDLMMALHLSSTGKARTLLDDGSWLVVNRTTNTGTRYDFWGIKDGVCHGAHTNCDHLDVYAKDHGLVSWSVAAGARRWYPV